MTEPRIIKTMGHCYNGTGWEKCSFYKFSEVKKVGMCKLFGGVNGVEKNSSESLVLCNKLYGEHYEGKP